eukprot:6129167-Pleurochrysis_carterae.AAC.2
MVRASDALKVGPPRPFWHLTRPERAAPKGSGGGRHLGRTPFTMKFLNYACVEICPSIGGAASSQRAACAASTQTA